MKNQIGQHPVTKEFYFFRYRYLKGGDCKEITQLWIYTSSDGLVFQERMGTYEKNPIKAVNALLNHNFWR